MDEEISEVGYSDLSLYDDETASFETNIDDDDLIRILTNVIHAREAIRNGEVKSVH